MSSCPCSSNKDNNSNKYNTVNHLPILPDDSSYDNVCTNISELFDYFDQTRKQVLVDLTNGDINKAVGRINNDAECKIKMGTVKHNIKDLIERNILIPMSDNNYVCKSCDMLDKLFADLKSLSSREIIKPECGEYMDKYFILDDYGDIIQYIKNSNIQKHMITRLVSFNELSKACNPNLEKLADMKYYGLDSFTNMVMVNWILSYIMDKINMECVRVLYYPFICANNGYMLMEHNNYNDLKRFKFTGIDQIWSVFCQLFAILNHVRSYELSFANVDNVLLIENSLHFRKVYDDIDITGNLILKLNDLTSAGINIGPIRIYNRVEVIDDMHNFYESNLVTWDRQYEMADLGQEPSYYVTYKIGSNEYYNIFTNELNDRNELKISLASELSGKRNSKRDAFLYVNKLGLPLYRGSFDAYRLLLVLCTNSSFYHMMVSDKYIQKIWRAMWINDTDYNKINDRLKEYIDNDERSIDSEDIYTTMLLDLNMRCDIVGYVWNLIKLYNRNITIEKNRIDGKHDENSIKSPS
jgi:hypothetical protein